MDSKNSDIQKNSFSIEVRKDKKHRRSFSNLRNPAKAREYLSAARKPISDRKQKSFQEFYSWEEIKKVGNADLGYQDQNFTFIDNSADVFNPINSQKKKLKRNRSLMDEHFSNK